MRKLIASNNPTQYNSMPVWQFGVSHISGGMTMRKFKKVNNIKQDIHNENFKLMLAEMQYRIWRIVG
jgi:hypothetical protein